MSKICTKCNKSVYPLEELKCLDKIWHKGCFKCWDCGLALNMKTYKGFDKKPYCSAHYPQMKATMVADTPEMQRIAQNTKLQSQVKYHEDFEKNIKGSKIEVSDDPETLRIKQVNHLVSQNEYKDKGAGAAAAAAKIEARRQSLPPSMTARTTGERWMPGPTTSNGGDKSGVVKSSPYTDRTTTHSTVYTAGGKVEGVPRVHRIGSIADYDPVNDNYGSLTQGYHPTSTSRQSQSWEETVPITPSSRPTSTALASPVRTSAINPADSVDGSTVVEDEAEVQRTGPTDEVFDEQPEAGGVGESNLSPVLKANGNNHRGEGDGQQEAVSAIECNSPVNEIRRSVEQEPVCAETTTTIAQDRDEEEDDEEPGTSMNGAVFVALYDYEQADEDEVGFMENDEVVNVRLIDDGWMYGTVSRTGKRGMFPSNYVEPLQ